MAANSARSAHRRRSTPSGAAMDADDPQLSFMLQAGAAATRHEACAAFRGLWHHATPAQRAELFGVLRDQLASLPLYGANSAEVLALLTAMVRAPSGTPGLDDEMTSAVVDALAPELAAPNAAVVARGMGRPCVVGQVLTATC